MNRGRYTIVTGAAILAVGITLLSIGFLQFMGVISSPLNEFATDFQLKAGESKTLSFYVSDTSRPVNIMVIFSSNSGGEIRSQLTDPQGNILFDTTSQTVRDFPATTAGTYKLVMTNIGSSPTTISGAAIRQTFTQESVQSIMFAGAAPTFGVGLIMLIAGPLMMRLGRKHNKIDASLSSNSRL
jgi:hypothetical protein